MSAAPEVSIVRTVDVSGWALRVGSDEEPRILDLDLAARLGFERPRDIRKLVSRMHSAGKLNGLDVRATVAQTPKGGRPGVEYWLPEASALKVIAKSDTRKADAILDEVIAVFIAARRGLIPVPVPVPSPLPIEAASTTRTGDVPELRKRISDLCKVAANATGRSLQAIHGYVRATWTTSIHRIPIAVWPWVERNLEAIALRKVPLPPPRRPQPLRLLTGGASATKQTAFPFANPEQETKTS